MPLLDKPEVERLLMTAPVWCPDCETWTRKNYCRRLDQFFWDGHAPGCEHYHDDPDCRKYDLTTGEPDPPIYTQQSSLPEGAVKASEIKPGQCFRKRQGQFAYMRINDSSAKYFRLDHERCIYGVAHNGNMAEVPKDHFVIPCGPEQMVKNLVAEQVWEKAVGVAQRADR